VSNPTTYWDYIQVESLLSLQGGLERDDAKITNDEVMFITVHQIDELWMKLIVRELVAARDLFVRVPVPEQSLAAAVRGVDRMSTLLRMIAEHFALMETLTTRDYLAFRDKLNPASGFQSAQLREIEILAGMPEEDRIPLGQEKSYLQMLLNADGTPSSAYLRVQRRLADRPTLRDAVTAWIYRTPIQGSTPDDPDDALAVARFIDRYCDAHAASARAALALALQNAVTDGDRARLAGRYDREIAGARAFLNAEELSDPDDKARASRVRAALVFIESYRELPLLAWPRAVLDGLIAFEQAFVIFRQRHARMVERVIGRRTGTGGSAGVDYLDQTALRYRIFREIWATRTLLVQQTMLPPVEHPERYGFAGPATP
jgi:tryptophan 2,3-dioxygenase